MLQWKKRPRVKVRAKSVGCLVHSPQGSRINDTLKKGERKVVQGLPGQLQTRRSDGEIVGLVSAYCRYQDIWVRWGVYSPSRYDIDLHALQFTLPTLTICG